MSFSRGEEKSSCGTGFVVNRHARASHGILRRALDALECVEHRGACGADHVTGDGAGVMADIPFEMLGQERGSVAVATLFITPDAERTGTPQRVFEETFAFHGMEVLGYRDVPVEPSVLGPQARASMPVIRHAFIARPSRIRTAYAFETLLHLAKQATRTKGREAGLDHHLFFTSLSSRTIVYKALTRSADLARFYPDLDNPAFETRFALFHRRFSTNTRTSWDKAQPFRMLGHNGEINTIAGNRSWAYSREQDLGVAPDELLTREGISDSGNVNEMVEALKFRSSIPHLEEILAIMIPSATERTDYHRFWSRAMEPWDGPAFITFCDGKTIGARLDRNGFRPCRWAMTADEFHLASEAGIFGVDEGDVLAKGTLVAGSGVRVDLETGDTRFRDPAHSETNRDATFDPRLISLIDVPCDDAPAPTHERHLFGLTHEELEMILVPMIATGKEPIGSMGDTARPALLSEQPRSFFDHFFQDFAQVTNPAVDFLRERLVTDLTTYLGRRPNVFQPKELIPAPPAIEVDSPILSLSQMAALRRVADDDRIRPRIVPCELAITFARDAGPDGMRERLDGLGSAAVQAARERRGIIVLSDRDATPDTPPIPSLLALRAVVRALNAAGRRLDAAIVVDAADVRSTHHVACLVGFGATAVSPRLALQIARTDNRRVLAELSPTARERNLIEALESGLLKIMSKMGISVVRAYQSAKLFSCIGLGEEIVAAYFRGLTSPVGGLTLDALARSILARAEIARGATAETRLPRTYQHREHNRGAEGERHSMTARRTKLLHELLRETDAGSAQERALWDRYLELGAQDEPINIRHLLELRTATTPVDVDDVQPASEIVTTFGSGSMSFGAISAEAQRDIIVAMRRVGGRSASGEGGENPYYFVDGTTATVKQVASGRFGVTAEYLVAGQEIEIKIAQGAKPGEGGQLMGVKVGAEIARARYSMPNVDLISPPPQHDIYSIEDLKELIYELKQVVPTARVTVKLVSGKNIGTIAAGVVKAGADAIMISGGDGGTGAASISSMKHAGLPWEIGLAEAHRTLVEQGLRHNVVLRTDGGLHSGRDVVVAALLGAQEFGFGKLLLIAEGCVMARVCEKNTCPTGIATHAPKYTAKYRGRADDVARVLMLLAEDARTHLAHVGARCLADVTGRGELLAEHPRHANLIAERCIDLSRFTAEVPLGEPRDVKPFFSGVSALNNRIVADAAAAITGGPPVELSYSVQPTDRAVLGRLAGAIAETARDRRLRDIEMHPGVDTHGRDYGPPPDSVRVRFDGSAGQGFAVFLTRGVRVELVGEANDSVCKGMNGGSVIIRPSPDAPFDPGENAIIGNCALYGATGGRLHVGGLAGDRFAVRNSGATAVVEGVGLHACEYMTNGCVVILGGVLQNVGAGMTGGELYLRRDNLEHVNREFLVPLELDDDAATTLRGLLEDHAARTTSRAARTLLDAWTETRATFRRLIPVGAVS